MQAICKFVASDAKDMSYIQNEMKARDAMSARLQRQVALLEKKSRRDPGSREKNNALIAEIEEREYKILDLPYPNVQSPETFRFTPAPRRQVTNSNSSS